MNKKTSKLKKPNGAKPIVPRSFSQHPQTVAWNKFIETDKYVRLVDGATMGLPVRCEMYLANRINSSYKEGWDAAEKNFG